MNKLPIPRWMIPRAAALAGYVLVLRPWHLQWGATAKEVRQPFPGDELVPQPQMAATHAIMIHAPAQAVWSWLVQIGQGRGGFYSYDSLENLIGLERKMLLGIKKRAEQLQA